MAHRSDGNRSSSSSLSSLSSSTLQASSPPVNNDTQETEVEFSVNAKLDMLELITTDDVWAWMTQVNTGDKEEWKKTSHLKIVIDATDFGDWEDDTWCLFLATFAPMSHNIDHITIHIKGKVLFTRHNYVKPQIYIQQEVTVKKSTKGKQRAHDHESSDSSGSKQARSNNNNDTTPSSTTSYAPRKVPAHTINLHIYEKQIIKDLLDLFGNRDPPIPYITIQGPMELSLRRHIISTLNPCYRDHPRLLAEAGYAASDSTAVSEAEAWEASSARELRFLAGETQDQEDFGAPQKGGKGGNGVKYHGLGEWVVPSGKGGRSVWGWKVGGATKVFRGPVEGWVGREPK